MSGRDLIGFSCGSFVQKWAVTARQLFKYSVPGLFGAVRGVAAVGVHGHASLSAAELHVLELNMLCYVTRPDSVVMELEVDAKANGDDCLQKVNFFY